VENVKEEKVLEEKIEYTIDKAIADLSWKFMTTEDYYQAISTGALVKKPGFIDDMKFFLDYPDHPMAGQNRFKRIHAADIIRKYCKKLKSKLSQEILDELHIALFDCCPAVRHSIAAVLFYSGNDTSISFLQRLLDIEKESKIVKKTAEIALIKMKFPCPFPQKGILAFVSDNINLAIEMNSFCKENNKKMFFPEPNSPDFSVMPFFAMIVDRNFLDKSVWKDYCDYCDEDNTPVVIIDSKIEKSIEKYPLRPAHDHVFLIEQWYESEIIEKLKSLILQ